MEQTYTDFFPRFALGRPAEAKHRVRQSPRHLPHPLASETHLGRAVAVTGCARPRSPSWMKSCRARGGLWRPRATTSFGHSHTQQPPRPCSGQSREGLGQEQPSYPDPGYRVRRVLSCFARLGSGLRLNSPDRTPRSGWPGVGPKSLQQGASTDPRGPLVIHQAKRLAHLQTWRGDGEHSGPDPPDQPRPAGPKPSKETPGHQPRGFDH